MTAIPRPALYLGGGALVALVLHFFTCSVFDGGVHLLAHEAGGHAVFAWVLGRMAIPQVWLTTWTEPSRFMETLILLGLGAAAYHAHKQERRTLAVAAAAFAVLYPFLAFTRANELLCIAGGHLGEIGWGAFFFYRAARGGFFQDQERPLYASLGWFLWLGNVTLFFGLATNGPKRAAYESISLAEGIENDFVRVAALTGSSLGRVSFFMLVIALVVPPLGAALGWLQAKDEGSP